MNRFKLIVGDWSHDGHGMTQEFIIESNISIYDLRLAYIAGEEIIGVSFSKFFSNYDQSFMSKDLEEKLSKYIDLSIFDLDQDLDPEEYIHIWLQIAKIGRPDFEYKSVDYNIPEMEIGGYGLFH